MKYLARWFSRYQVLGFTALFALIVIGFEGVAGLGLPALFWCREWYGLLFIGFVVAVFFALCSFIGFLLDHEKVGLPANRSGLRQYFLRTIWLPTVIVIVRGIWRQVSHASCGMEWVMVVGYLIGLAFVWFGAPQLNRLSSILAEKPWFVKLVSKLAKRDPNEPFDPWLHAYALVTALLLGLIYLGFAIWPDPINAAVAICILLGLIVLTYGALRFFIPRFMLLVVIGLVVWVALANQLPRKHQYEELKELDTVDLGNPPKGAALLSDRDALIAWRKYLADNCHEAKPKLIVLMTSGGGVRASVWTAAVLRELDQQRPCGYLQHIRVIGGASGGMVGAGYWITQRVFVNKPAVYDDQLRGVTADALDSVARYLALRDAPALFIPARIPDRGFALEQAWKNNAPAMAHLFKDLRAHEASGVAPSLIYAPASLDDGRRVLVSNLDLDYMTRHFIDGHEATRSAFEFFKMFGDDKLTVATAARMSASFPYVSSATELPTTKLRRLGDAGYFDNYGGFVISSWLAQNRQWLIDNTSGVLVVQVRDSPVGAGNRSIDAGPSNNRFARAFSELTAPLQGVASTRTKAMHFRTDFELATVAPLFGKGFVEQVEIELPEGLAPLSWNLTKQAANAIIEHAPKEVSAKMKTIETWWKAAPAARPAAQIPATPENQNATIPTGAVRSRASTSPL